MNKLTIYCSKIRKNMIYLDVYGKQYWIETCSVYRSVKKTVKNNVEYYTVKCYDDEKDEYYYENDTWKSDIFSCFFGEIPTLNDCRNAILYLETISHLIILNRFLPDLNDDIINFLKSMICSDINLKLLANITCRYKK